MFKKRRTKALSHVDWAMSLAIFLLYLAWFFIFIKPLVVPSEEIGDLISVLDDGIKDNVFEDVERVYTFIPNVPSDSTDLEPIIVDYTQSWNQSRIAHSADHFEIDNNKLFFLGNLSNSTRFTMYHPLKKLKRTTERRVHASEDKTTYESFSAYFDNALLDYVHFSGARRLVDFSIELDDSDFSGDDSFTNWSFLAKYNLEGDEANNSAYVFADNSRVYSYMTPNDNKNHTVVLSFVFYNYTDYYFDPVSNGDLEYLIRPRCYSYTSDYLTLYDSEGGVTITFDDNITYSLCTNDTNVLLDLAFDLDEEVNYNLYFFEGPLSDMLDYPIAPVEGVTETLEIVSRENAQYYNNRDYSYMKQLFGFPDTKDFNVTISGEGFTASYGTQHPDIADIYAQKIETFTLDRDLNQERVTVLLTVW